MLTVLLPVYNASEHLEETLESILSQSFESFVVHAINDGSTDDSLDLLNRWAARDKRILVYNQENQGLVKTLNEALFKVQTEFFCRHDADDVSHQDRFIKQMNFLQNSPDVGIVGTTFSVANGISGDIQAVPLDHDSIQYFLPYANSFAHGSILGRSSLIQKGFFYSPSAEHAYIEDYELWSRMAKVTRLANLPELLYVYRDNPEGLSGKNTSIQRSNARHLQVKIWKELTFHEPSVQSQITTKVQDLFVEQRRRLFRSAITHLLNEENPNQLWKKHLLGILDTLEGGDR